MPTYVVRARSGLLDSRQRRELAERITTVHADATGAPRSFAQVVIEDLLAADHFVGGRPAAPDTVFVHGHVRAGRDRATTTAIVTGVRDAAQSVAGVPAAAIWVYLSEIPPERMVEFGRALPDPGGEAAWIADLPSAAAARIHDLDAPGDAAT